MNFGAVWQNMLRVGLPRWLRDTNGLIIGLRSPDGNWTAGNSNFDGAYSSLLGKPTTISGYGITDAATSAALTSGLAGKYGNPTGTTAQYVRGDGSLATLPTGVSQQQSDWSASSGVTAIANKPTTLAGYGISDAVSASALSSTLSSYANAASVTSALANKADKVTILYTYPTRGLNAAVQISATRDADVVYPVDVTISSLITNVEGVVFLEYADNAAMTTNLVTVMSAGQLLGGVINITNRGTVTLMGRIPAGKFARIRTQNVQGTPTFASRQGQEVFF